MEGPAVSLPVLTQTRQSWVILSRPCGTQFGASSFLKRPVQPVRNEFGFSAAEVRFSRHLAPETPRLACTSFVVTNLG